MKKNIKASNHSKSNGHTKNNTPEKEDSSISPDDKTNISIISENPTNKDRLIGRLATLFLLLAVASICIFAYYSYEILDSNQSNISHDGICEEKLENLRKEYKDYVENINAMQTSKMIEMERRIEAKLKSLYDHINLVDLNSRNPLSGNDVKSKPINFNQHPFEEPTTKINQNDVNKDSKFDDNLQHSNQFNMQNDLKKVLPSQPFENQNEYTHTAKNDIGGLKNQGTQKKNPYLSSSQDTEVNQDKEFVYGAQSKSTLKDGNSAIPNKDNSHLKNQHHSYNTNQNNDFAFSGENKKKQEPISNKNNIYSKHSNQEPGNSYENVEEFEKTPKENMQQKDQLHQYNAKMMRNGVNDPAEKLSLIKNKLKNKYTDEIIQEILDNFDVILTAETNFSVAKFDSYIDALANLQRILGENHPQCISGMAMLAASLYKAGMLLEAKDLAIGSLNFSLQINKPRHRIYDILGSIEFNLDHFALAIEYFMNSLEVNTPYSDSTRQIELYKNIGKTYSRLSNYESAMKYFTMSINEIVNQYGDDNIRIAEPYIDMAQISSKLLSKEVAIQYQEKAISIIEKNQPSDLYLGNFYKRIGDNYVELEEINLATKYYNIALQHATQYFGEFHPKAAVIYESLGDLHFQTRQYEKALENYRKCNLINKNVYGENTPIMAKILTKIGRLHIAFKNSQAALQVTEKALKIVASIYGSSHIECSQLNYMLGLINLNERNPEQALKYYFEALKINIQYYGESNLKTAKIVTEIADIYKITKNYKKALEFIDRAVLIYKDLYGEVNGAMSELVFEHGVISFYAGTVEMALESHKRALNIRIQLFGESSTKAAQSLYMIGYVNLHMNNIDEALAYLNNALKIQLTLYDSNNSETEMEIATTLNALSSLYVKLENYEKGIEYQKNAYDIYLKLKGETHPITLESSQKIGSYYLLQKDYNSALIYLNKCYDALIDQGNEAHLNVISNLIQQCMNGLNK